MKPAGHALVSNKIQENTCQTKTANGQYHPSFFYRMATGNVRPPRKTTSSQSKASSVMSSPDKVVEAISNGILARRYGVGHRLVEADLANSFNVSRGTVREALKKLAAQGVVRLDPHRGAAIRPLSRREAECLVIVLEVLCGLAARLAAEKIAQGRSRVRFIAAANLLDGKTTTGSEQFLSDRAHYYAEILDIAENAELNRLMPVPQIHLFRSQFHNFLRPSNIKAMQKEYREVSAAILAGDGALAEKRMRKHMSKTRERIATLDEQAFDQQY
jgi:DNA-binding GntR family transcriptional regulator